MADFFAELKRRHIYRVGAAYVVVAWALTQGVAVLAQVFSLPAWIAQTAIVLLALGFPLALMTTWMIESKPHQAVASAVASKPTAVDWTLIGALAVVLIFMGYRQLAPTPQAGVDAARSASLNPRAGISLAVLPFANLSDDETQTFFSDGITEEIITTLARIPDLRVVARESASQFKGQQRDLRAVGQSLGATHLIEGSVRKAGARVRITARLVKAEDGVNTWASSYDRELTDVFAIQEEIATSIAGALRMPLGLRPGEQLVANRDIDPDSYQQFLRGKAALLRARSAYLDQIALLEPVAQKNTNYAPAWAAVAQAYSYAAQFARYSTPEEARRMRESYEQKATAATRRAVELDPDFVDGQVALARIQSGPRRLILREDILRAALASDPNHPRALDSYSGLLVLVGRIKDGVAMKQQVHQLEPYAPLYTGNLAQALWQDGQTDAAIALWKETFDAEGSGAGPGLARVYASLGRYEDAARVGDEALLQPRNQRFRTLISDFSRLMRTAPQKAAQPEKLPRLSDLSFVYLYIGAPERALEPYEEANLSSNEVSLLFHSTYALVRNTPRFKKVIQDSGLVNYWRERGWPEFCRPVGADDFACS
jgi:TolB-like protein